MYENYGWKFTLTAIITVLWGLALYFNPIPRGLDLSGGSEIIYTLDFGGRMPSVALRRASTGASFFSGWPAWSESRACNQAMRTRRSGFTAAGWPPAAAAESSRALTRA